MHEVFRLSGTRQVIAGYDPPNVITLADELERAVGEGSPTASDLSKALVECVCKTILTDRDVEIETNWDFPRLFGKTLECLRMFPNGYAEPRRAQEGLMRLVRGLQQAVQGLSELRNLDGLASHAPDGYEAGFERIQLELSARAADTIVHFLYNTHRHYPRPAETHGRLYYNDYEKFNDLIDDTHEPIEIAGMQMRPSEVLYNADPEHQAYREMLIDYQNNPPE